MPRECKECGKEFDPCQRQRYCSITCRDRAGYRKTRDNAKGVARKNAQATERRREQRALELARHPIRWEQAKLLGCCLLCGELYPSKASILTKRRYCSKKCQGEAKQGARNPSWKGRFLSPDGYVLLRSVAVPVEDRELARQMANKRDQVAEHRLVMAKKLGRPLRPDEVVHHVNGVKTDNRPENLMVMDDADHHRTHADEKLLIIRLQARVEGLEVEVQELEDTLGKRVSALMRAFCCLLDDLGLDRGAGSLD
jgi:hypothetical protein